MTVARLTLRSSARRKAAGAFMSAICLASGLAGGAVSASGGQTRFVGEVVAISRSSSVGRESVTHLTLRTVECLQGACEPFVLLPVEGALQNLPAPHLGQRLTARVGTGAVALELPTASAPSSELASRKDR